MVTQFVNIPLGLGNPLAPQRKEWVTAALAGAGLALSLFGMGSSAKAQREAAKKQKLAEAKEDAWYNRKYNESYLDTAAGQNLVRRAKDYAKENWRKAAGAQAVAGGTDAATAMAKEAGNKMVGNTIADIAATDAARRDRVDDMHRQAQEKFAEMDMARENQRAQNISNATSAASNALMTAASVAGAASPKQAPNLAGANNNSTPAGTTNTQTTVPVGSLSDGTHPLYEDADTLKQLMQG